MKDHETFTRPPHWITWFIRPFASICFNDTKPCQNSGENLQWIITRCRRSLRVTHPPAKVSLDFTSTVNFLGHQIIKLFCLRDVSFNAVLKISFGHGLPRDLLPVSDDEMQRIAAQTGATVEFCWPCIGYNGHSPILHYALIMDMHIQNLSCCTVFKLKGVFQPLLASEDRNPLGHGSTSRLNIYMYVWIWVCIDIHFYMHS